MSKKDKFVNQLKQINSNIKILGEYKNYRSPIKISINEIEHFITPRSLYEGKETVTKLLINQTEDFIKKAKSIHNNKYDYSLVNYVDSLTKIKIICSVHNIFEQSPSHHLMGRGCQICGYQNNTHGWSYKDWEQAGLNSKNFTGFKLYVVKCWNSSESFYKVGKTYTELSNRFRKNFPYNWEILETIESTAHNISSLETSMKAKNLSNKYLPKLNFCGKNECFSKIQY